MGKEYNIKVLVRFEDDNREKKLKYNIKIDMPIDLTFLLGLRHVYLIFKFLQIADKICEADLHKLYGKLGTYI